MLQRAARARSRLRSPRTVKRAPRRAIVDVERGLDLAQVRVERAAQAREALVVDRVELRPRPAWPRIQTLQLAAQRMATVPAVMRTSTKRSDERRRCPGKFTTRLFAVRAGELGRISSSTGPRPARAARVPTMRLADRARLRVELRLQALQPLVLLRQRQLRRRARRPACPGAGCRGRRTSRRSRARARALSVASKSASVSPGKADDEVGRQADVRAAPCAAGARSSGIRARCSRASSPRARGPSPTAPAGARAARACRQRGVRVDQALREFARMRGGVADALDAVDLGDVAQQLGEIRRRAPSIVAAPGVDVLAEQRHFLHALRARGRRSRRPRRRTGARLPRRACTARRRSCSTCCSLP